MTRAIPIGLAVLLAGSPVAGQAAPADRFDEAKINAVFAAYAGHDAPGCALGIYRGGRVALSRGYGMADLERRVPITPATLFDIGSTSKQFAAAAIALLVGDGRLRFEDDVRRYVPELPDYGTPITIDHLVRHTSGLRDYIGILYLGGRRFDDASDDDEALAAIVRQRALNFAPGTKWDYSNSGFFLLSVIVKRVTGKTLAEFSRERLFGPLGMEESHFRDDHLRVVPGRAMGYAPRREGGYEIDMSNWDQTGDGAVWTSVDELVRWDRNFESGAVGGAQLSARLVEPGRLTSGRPHGYGRGLFVDTYRGQDRVHHGGSWGGFRAMLMRFPAAQTSIAVLCNVASANTQRLAEGVADVVLADRLAPVRRDSTAEAARPEPLADSAAFVGLYYSEGEQNVVRITTRDGALFGGPGTTSVRLRRAAPDRFEADGMPAVLEFVRRGGGPADSLRLSIRGEPQDPYVRVAPAQPTESELRELAGTYVSAELDATYQLVVEDGALRIRARTQPGTPLRPAMRDAFLGQQFIRFVRDRRGRVTGFEMSMGRVKRIGFDRR